MDAPDHLQHLRADTEALAATLREETVAAPVRACPGWDLRALAGHMGFIHRWAAAAVRTGSAPEPAAIGDAPSDVGELAAWVREGGRTLAGELAARDGDSPTWHPFPAPPVVSVWRRRQAQETSLHRWDAQDAVGAAGPIDAPMAADGVAEYFEVMLPRRFARDGGSPPAVDGWLGVRAVDVGRTWAVGVEDGRVRAVADPDVRVAAELRGDAQDLLLTLWARQDRATLEVRGDAALASAWLALEGN